MKKIHIYHHMYLLFFVLCSNFLFTTFDFHQENIHTDEQIKQQRKESKYTYQRLKKQLLETLKAHQDDPQLEQEDDVDLKSQLPGHTQEEKQDTHQHFLKIHQNKPFVLVTLQTDQNLGMQSRFIETIGVAIAWLGGWIGSGAALTAAEIAALEAAKIAAAKVAVGAAGVYVAGSVIKDQVNKNKKSDGNCGGGGNGGNENNGKGDKNKPSQEQKALEIKKDQEFREQVNKSYQISSLEKTNPAQAEKEREEQRASLARADAEEKKKKLIENYFPQSMPNREQALIEAGLIKDTRPGYTLINNPVAVDSLNKASTSQATVTTEAKVPTVVTQEPAAPQTPIVSKPAEHQQEPTTVTTTPLTTTTTPSRTTAQVPSSTQLPATQQPLTPTLPKQKVVIAPTPVTALPDFTPLNSHIAMQAFIPAHATTTSQVPTKIKAPTNEVITDTDDDIVAKVFSGSPTPPPPDNDPDDDPEDYEESIKKSKKVVSEDSSKEIKKSQITSEFETILKNSLKSLENLLKDTIPGETTSGRARQYMKNGSYEDAVKDFYSLNPRNVQKMSGKEGLHGVLPDGRSINVRMESTFPTSRSTITSTPTAEIMKSGKTTPTIEIMNPGGGGTRIKIRYENKL